MAKRTRNLSLLSIAVFAAIVSAGYASRRSSSARLDGSLARALGQADTAAADGGVDPIARLLLDVSFEIDLGLQWVVGAVAPESDFSGAVRKAAP